MMAPTIRVDDEVFALLQSKAKAFVDTPNTVLRRKLGLSDQGGSTANGTNMSQGGLQVLVEAGTLRDGEQLTWRRRDTTYVCVVTSSGHLLLEDGTRWASPSGAARHLAGYEVNGWRVWKSASGASLDDLR